jgi:hypothetical protein
LSSPCRGAACSAPCSPSAQSGSSG